MLYIDSDMVATSTLDTFQEDISQRLSGNAWDQCEAFFIRERPLTKRRAAPRLIVTHG